MTKPRLTSREAQILGLMNEGLRPSGIAQKLGLGIRTINFHQANLYSKLGVHSAIEALRLARDLSLIPA